MPSSSQYSYCYNTDIPTITTENNDYTISITVHSTGGYEGVSFALTFDESTIGCKSIISFDFDLGSYTVTSTTYGHGFYISDTYVTAGSNAFNVKSSIQADLNTSGVATHSLAFTVTSSIMYLILPLSSISGTETIYMRNLKVQSIDNIVNAFKINQIELDTCTIYEYTKTTD